MTSTKVPKYAFTFGTQPHVYGLHDVMAPGALGPILNYEFMYVIEDEHWRG